MHYTVQSVYILGGIGGGDSLFCDSAQQLMGIPAVSPILTSIGSLPVYKSNC